MDETERVARRRFATINLARFAGVGCILFGIAVAHRALDLPIALAWVALGAGLFCAFALPLILARRWRTPR